MLLLLACAGSSDTKAPPADDSAPADDTGTADWSGVQEILEANCLSCHYDGGPASISLASWEAAAAMADAIAAVTASRAMPPYLVDASGECGEWEDPPALTDEQIQLLADWAAAGAPLGKGTFAIPERPTLEPDWTADIGGDYTPSAEGVDDFRCFLLDRSDRGAEYVTGFDLLPTSLEQTHHVTIMKLNDAEALTVAEARDAAEDRLGWSCTTPPVDLATPLAIWHTGMEPLTMPEGTGLAMDAGMPILLYTHYYTAEGVVTDHTEIQLTLADTVEHPARMPAFQAPNFELEPGQAWVSHSETIPLSDLDFTADTRIFGSAPHMHARGTELEVTLHEPSGDRCLVRTTVWDYHQQRMFFYAEPFSVDPASTGEITCTWNTMDDTEPVESGVSAWQEMCLSALFVTDG